VAQTQLLALVGTELVNYEMQSFFGIWITPSSNFGLCGNQCKGKQ